MMCLPSTSMAATLSSVAQQEAPHHGDDGVIASWCQPGCVTKLPGVVPRVADTAIYPRLRTRRRPPFIVLDCC